MSANGTELARAALSDRILLYSYRLKVEASGEGPRRAKLENISVNYLYDHDHLYGPWLPVHEDGAGTATEL